MRASVPTSVVDNEYENFPKGYYDGNIDSAEVRDPNDDGSWLMIRLAVDEITPKEGTADPGRGRFSSDITVKTDGVDLFEVEDFNNPDLPFGIVRGAGLLAGLAEALGVGERDEQTGQVVADLEAVAQAVTGGQFEGERVGFGVSHYTNSKGDTYDQFERFGPAS